MSGKYTKAGKRSFGSRFVYLMLALVLVLGCTVGGTLAWLTTQSEKVDNTFVAGQIGELKLEEEADQIANEDGHQFIVIPGVDITKDPKVTYMPTTETGTVPVDAYVFVKLTGIESGKWTLENGKYVIRSKNNVVLSFQIADGWTAVPDVANVYYKTSSGATGLTNDPIIKENKITVSNLITEKDVETVAAAADKLTFTAYAIQQQGFENVTAAWNEVSGANTTTP